MIVARPIFQLIPETTACLERPVEIRHAEADVMNAGTAARHELADRTVVAVRHHELDRHVAQRDRDDGRAIGSLGWARLNAEDVTVEGGGGEIGNGDTNVRDGGSRHGSLRA